MKPYDLESEVFKIEMQETIKHAIDLYKNLSKSPISTRFENTLKCLQESIRLSQWIIDHYDDKTTLHENIEILNQVEELNESIAMDFCSYTDLG